MANHPDTGNAMPVNVRSLLSRLRHSTVSRRTAVTLIALVTLSSGSLAFCDKIHDAARDGDLVKVTALLKQNPDLVFSKDDGGETPLHLAAANGHKDVVELLLASKAEANAKDNAGVTPLYLAACEGHKDVAELLVASKADVNANDNDSSTPLHCAAIMGRKDVVELLLANKAEVNAKTSCTGETPLQYAAIARHKDVAELLRQYGGQSTSTPMEPTPINQAVRNGDVAKVQALLKEHPDLILSKDNEGKTPLHWAAAIGNPYLTQMLLIDHADPSAKDRCGFTPLHAAASSGGDTVGVLLANQSLLGYKLDVNARDNDQATPLHAAAAGGHLRAVELLLNAGAEVDAKARGESTPLHWAASIGRNNRKGVVEALLAHGADVNAKADNGGTPLADALSKHHNDVAKLLRQHGGHE